MYSKLSFLLARLRPILLDGSMLFVVSTMIVNGGNYAYNIALSRFLNPAAFSEAGIVVTFLLIFSFLAMTFQIVAAKFSVVLDGLDRSAFSHWMKKISLFIGVLLGAVILMGSNSLASFFNLPNEGVFVFFAIAMPFFFLMSVKRGMLQGAEKFIRLSGSYQAEMWGRCILTFAFLMIFPNHIAMVTSAAVCASVLLGNGAMGIDKISLSAQLPANTRKQVISFFLLTAGYECAQVLINYSDVLLVKHLFTSEEAGFYTSMSLVGRMVYFLTWMLVMVLVPKILNLKKAGKPYRGLFNTYLFGICAFASGMVIATFLFPKLIVSIVFGEAYLAMADLLWVYTLATMLFALANLFVYYFLSADNYKPVFVAIGVGVVQVALLLTFSSSLASMIWIQVFDMGLLLVVMLTFYLKK